MKVLCYWYQHQSKYVKWSSTLSSKFKVTNDVRHGGVLSPLLFNVYVNELSELLYKSGIGGNMGASSGLQQLLNTCNDYCELRDFMFKAKKSMCVYFSIDKNKHCGLPVIYLGNCVCQFVRD